MSNLKKEIYEGKARWAASVARDNKEIFLENGGTQEEADELMDICTNRHKLHQNTYQNALSLFNTESGDYDNLYKIFYSLEDWVGVTCLYEYYETDFDWFADLIEKEKYLDDDGEEDYNLYVEESVKIIYDGIEKLNTLVEKKLKEIDFEYKTDYCPSGASRF